MIKQILGRLPRKQASKPENGRTNGESGGGGGGRGAVVLSNAVKTITRGMGSISLSTTSTTTTPNGSFNLSSYISEPLPPAFKDVPGSDRENLLIKKLRLCCVVFDFTDHSSNPREKEIKRQILAEAADYFASGNCKFTEAVMEELVKMVSINLFRPLPSASLPSSLESLRVDKPESEEDEPLMDPAWPHLQIVYDLLLRFVASQDTDAKSAKKYIDHSFVLKLLDLFDSEDYREREYLKTILHRIYGKFMVHRPFIRKAINNIFYRFIFETERYNGVAELLEILNSIINGFALPLKEEHKLFLVRALIPLHKPKCMQLYHPQLSSCIVQFVEKDFKLADTIIRGLLKYWPVTNSQKEVLFIRELEEVLENTQEAEFQRCMVPLFRQIARCLNSSHFQVAECALGLWNNDHIIDLITQNRFAVLPLVFPALEKNMRAHWSQVVQSLTAHVRKILLEMDQDLFLECQRKYEEEETKAQGIQEKREVTWQRLEAVAASKAESEVVGGMSLYFRPLPFHMLCNIL